VGLATFRVVGDLLPFWLKIPAFPCCFPPAHHEAGEGRAAKARLTGDSLILVPLLRVKAPTEG